jgi:hypothetical protein
MFTKKRNEKDYFYLAAYISDNLQAQTLEAVTNASIENAKRHSITVW